ncbi:YihY/virulence factor BrkB family protein [Nocardia sp. NPDC050712]|uniref:YihY/virulence factor BrkB family protein n=1 Tax=Nocardia sp. NPDC050712 TaxID=3155518 RepID=UPI0033E3AFFA
MAWVGRLRPVKFNLLRRRRVRVLVHTARVAWSDEFSDRAASLTYYSMLSLFPALLIAIAVLSMLGPSSSDTLANAAGRLGPDEGRTVLTDAIQHLQTAKALSGPAAIIGLGSAIWTVSGYLGAFMRAANALYGVPESRPFAKTILLRLALSALMVTAIVSTVVGFAVTSGAAAHLGEAVGLGSTGLRIWGLAKWPVLACLACVGLALVYWIAPNVRGQRLRWVTSGSVIAVAAWILSSAGLSFYASHFDSFDKVYGSVAAVVVVLIWLWLTNFALLFGAVIDAQLHRQRALRRYLRVEAPARRDQAKSLVPEVPVVATAPERVAVS